MFTLVEERHIESSPCLISLHFSIKHWTAFHSRTAIFANRFLLQNKLIKLTMSVSSVQAFSINGRQQDKYLFLCQLILS